MDYRVIKENDLFLLTDTNGNIPENHPYGLGLYTKDTRFLSKLDLKINGENPILLSSDADQNYKACILLTNPHMEEDGELILWRESVEIERSRFIYDDVLYEEIKVKNYFPKPVKFEISIHADADFLDMFVVRGFQNGDLGSRTGQTAEGNTLSFHYAGADKVKRSTLITWDKEAKKVDEKGKIDFEFELTHSETDTVTIAIKPQIGEAKVKTAAKKDEAMQKLEESYQKWNEQAASIKTDFTPLQRLVDRGLNDMRVLLTDAGFGPFPVAGLPWFGVPFGRDSLIAALQILPFQTEIAKGTLLTMAHYQGQTVDPWRDEQPGKIMHEIRFGELAATGQIPFTPYYGTVDATPLFLILLSEYVKWTGDTEFAGSLEKTIKNALMWIDEYGDRDKDLFVEYHQESSKGIANQGWKDSGDSVVHRNGEYAKTPIALAEVQGYVYQAKMGIADIYETMNQTERAAQLRRQANSLKQRFDEEFWMEDVQFYAIALDEKKEQVGTITSNPGHILFSGMLNEDRAKAVTEMLVSPKMFSGYGIRTMAEGEAGYNPMSYHDGSIWPHDNSISLLGMSKTGYQQEAGKVMNGLINAASHFEYDRLPELFCGYDSLAGKAVKYPVACSPQAWAAGTPLVFIQSMLGLFPDSLKKEIRLSPVLLDGMNALEVQNISIGEGQLSIAVIRSGVSFTVEVLKNTTGYALKSSGTLVQK
ncbi:amylo-alpha-1,6-glucosidase [Bacillus sp. V2I10]|uniref:amylo-alpha-1,6-glucosidase n=1 Tax=Bacillus sp. V2I10 TaxID=3042276 RepID=UPI00278354E3|nr:amylo-alpha-1,6-glucosidase [Bacillus sp. V2I10]MDQ0857401.1 glycogen debranching enzyme [Bacillus sp. V2I10]